ncbi:hypothetical protein Ddc_13528 [Ditylenchus destructor]|nr:hypothetical protein Ddc_13528 [Ditylenchus destructor]
MNLFNCAFLGLLLICFNNILAAGTGKERQAAGNGQTKTGSTKAAGSALAIADPETNATIGDVASKSETESDSSEDGVNSMKDDLVVKIKKTTFNHVELSKLSGADPTDIQKLNKIFEDVKTKISFSRRLTDEKRLQQTELMQKYWIEAKEIFAKISSGHACHIQHKGNVDQMYRQLLNEFDSQKTKAPEERKLKATILALKETFRIHKNAPKAQKSDHTKKKDTANAENIQSQMSEAEAQEKFICAVGAFSEYIDLYFAKALHNPKKGTGQTGRRRRKRGLITGILCAVGKVIWRLFLTLLWVLLCIGCGILPVQENMYNKNDYTCPYGMRKILFWVGLHEDPHVSEEEIPEFWN